MWPFAGVDAEMNRERGPLDERLAATTVLAGALEGGQKSGTCRLPNAPGHTHNGRSFECILACLWTEDETLGKSTASIVMHRVGTVQLLA